MVVENESKMVAKVLESVRESKLPEPGHPGTDISMPPDITRLNGAELSELMARYAALVSYAGWQLAQVEILYLARSSEYKIKRAQGYIVYRQNKEMTEREREYSLDHQSDLVKLSHAVTEVEQHVTLLKALMSGYQQCYQALSRELTRRGINTERGYA